MRRQQRSHGRGLRPFTHSARSLICIAQASAMLMPLIFDDRAASDEPRAVTVGTRGEGDRPLHERADVRLHRVHVLGQERLLDLRDQARVRQVDAFDLDLGRLLVEQVSSSFLVYLRIGLSGSKKPQPLKIRPYQPSML